MKTKQLLTQILNTGDITVLSNVTSVTVKGEKISRLAETIEQGKKSSPTVHVDFAVKQPSHLAAVLDKTKELGLIFQLEDAIQLGIFLIAMGIEHQTAEEVNVMMARLSDLIANFQQAE